MSLNIMPPNVFNVPLTSAILVICISQLNYGFDNLGYAAIQSIDAFEREFGIYDEKKHVYVLPTVWLSMFNSFGFIGLFFGVAIGSIVSKRFGRRWCMFSMSLWALVTATITITSKNSTQIMVGRVLNYLYTGMELAVVPVYQSEITPKTARGFIVGTYQLCLVIGGLLINAICYATQYRHDNSAFLIPFGMFYIVPSFVIATIWFIPESPRWLVLQDRHADALKSLTILRRGKFTDEEIADELNEMIAVSQSHLTVEKGKSSDMFKGTNLRRTVVVVFANFFLQATGQAFVTQYGALFIKQLGTINQFTMQMIQSVINVFISISAMFLVDSLGRRKLLLIGGVVQIIGLIAMAGLGTVKNAPYQIRAGIVAFMMVFICGYNFGWAPVVHTLSAELPSAKLRDLTYRLGSLVQVATNFTVAFTLPYLLNADYANLQSKVGFIYGSISICASIFAWLFVPDCRNKSLEEIDRLFEAGTPARHFSAAKSDPEDIHVEVAAAKSKQEAIHVEVVGKM